MPSSKLWAGALCLLLQHEETRCPHAAYHAAQLLEQLTGSQDLDSDTRQLCERASIRLAGVAFARTHTH